MSGVMRNGNLHIWNHIYPEEYKRIYGTTIYILYNIEGKFVANIHIYGARSIVLIF